MGMDFSALMKIKGAWDTFKMNHPRFPDFLNHVKRNGVIPGTEIQISVTYPNGQNIKSTIKVKESDVQLLESLGSLGL